MLNLYRYIEFSKTYSTLFDIDSKADTIVDTACRQSELSIVATLCQQSDIYCRLVTNRTIRMSWSHYRALLQVQDDAARLWYENETIKQTWSVRTLQRNISSQYYYRLLQSPAKDKVEAEMKSLTAPLQDKLEYMKNPVVAEFLGFHNNTDYSESDLEQSILDHLPQFLMEMGKGFAFVDLQMWPLSPEPFMAERCYLCTVNKEEIKNDNDWRTDAAVLTDGPVREPLE